jgi:hypothetical protein
MVALTTPASAQWRPYVSHYLGIAFAAPGELKVERGKYEAPVAGSRDMLVFSTAEDNIEYKVIVIDTTARANESATLLHEAIYLFQQDKRTVEDNYGRIDDRWYGRKLAVDLPNNGGRMLAGFYFINGRIVSLQATILPANGDYETPEAARLVDSLQVALGAYLVRVPDHAIELALPQ